MLKNYFKIALRNLVKHKGYSFINITGLAVGIASCLLIFMYVKDEVTYDKFQTNGDRIYRIISELEFGGNEMTLASTNRVEAKEYAEAVPAIAAFTRFQGTQLLIQKGEDYITEFSVVYADRGVLEMFDFSPISGSLNKALTNLNSVVITKEVALKYFDKVDVAGEELTVRLGGNTEVFIIDVVVDNFPTNTSLSFNMILPWAKYDAVSPINTNSSLWGDIGFGSFLMLQSGASVQDVEKQIKEVRISFNPGEDGEFSRSINNKLQALTDIHLNTDFQGGGDGIKVNSDPTFSYVLSAIALVILILACINFANLTVARSLPRAKEIGVRKVLGAVRGQLAFQFLSEALFVSIIAFVLGLIMAELFLPVFGELVNKTFTENITTDPVLIMSCLVLVLVTALIAGAYPSFVISRFSAIGTLNGRFKLSGKKYISKALVLIQFTIAGVLVIGTMAMNKQISFLINKDLGYNYENVAVVSLDSRQRNGKLLKDILLQNPNLEQLVLSRGYSSATALSYNDNQFVSTYSDCEMEYFDLIGVELKRGRLLNYGQDQYVLGEDTLLNLLVNEKFLELAGIEGDGLNEIINGGLGEPRYRIVGVMPDFHSSSAKSGVSSLMWSATSEDTPYQELILKYNSNFTSEVQTVVEEAWKQIEPYRPVSLSFMEEQNRNAFAEEQRWKSLITDSTFLAIIISCLGLFGLAHLSAQERQKEVGVRKVLGASVRQLVFILNAGFSKLVLLSFILTVPLAYYFVSSWLENFPDQITMGASLFVIPAIITFGIATATISIQSIKTANANPVDSLRNE